MQGFQRLAQKISYKFQTPVSCYKSCNMKLIPIFFDMSKTFATKQIQHTTLTQPIPELKKTFIEKYY